VSIGETTSVLGLFEVRSATARTPCESVEVATIEAFT
jgi:hypothetical protein